MFKVQSLLLAAAVGLMALTGCATSGSGGKPTVTPERMATIAELATYNGTIVWLAEHPQDRPHFQAALGALTLLAAGTNATPADVQNALANLPIKELSGPNGQVIVGSTVILYDSFVREHVNLDANVWLRPIVEALKRGLERGLAVRSAQAGEPVGQWVSESVPERASVRFVSNEHRVNHLRLQRGTHERKVKPTLRVSRADAADGVVLVNQFKQTTWGGASYDYFTTVAPWDGDFETSIDFGLSWRASFSFEAGDLVGGSRVAGDEAVQFRLVASL